MRAKLISFGLHALAATVGFLLPFFTDTRLPFPLRISDAPLRIRIAPPQPALEKPSGGGTQDETPASLGRPPLVATRKFLIPLRPTVAEPQLVVEPALNVDIPVEYANVNLPQFGSPFAPPGPPSGGRGKGGIGSDLDGPGIGPGAGPGISATPGEGPLVGPSVLYKQEPEFSEEARRAKVQGTIVVEVVVGTDGKAHDIRVRNSLGLGLDEKAVEAVSQWRFRPAMRAGKPIATGATIYVNFRLL